MLVKCTECGTLVSDKASKSPKCGKVFSAGVFLEGKGYGQGEFAYYKEPEVVQETQQFSGVNVQQNGGGGYGKIFWWIIGIIGALIWIFS